ncbi:hypothetical protein SUGI_0936150 [Cryptomeria japonica]|uniref:peroxidase 3 n=1 Tax=Cryptomeria japonica TaxID=3369 RepID=UPI00241492C7|nr:peroxidase 3 [Cryptomeria japonica]GLJ44561.1 hypothetical protein SUGI_0936150 [Cryptomeria japonica]
MASMNLNLIIVVALTTMVFLCDGRLVSNFYRHSCPSAEVIVKTVVEKHVSQDSTVAAALLRMHFHDCFVRGCDGSVLINSTANNTAEKAALPNLTLRRFDVIDDVKREVEKNCSGVVSCADILALATRDAVAKIDGPSWRVRTGRRDGVVSNQSEALANIPPPTSNLSQLQTFFARKGLALKDIVVLSGGHTIGNGHCNFFSNRLYNFSGKGDMDPALNASYAQQLKTKCKNLSDNTTFVEMDPNSSLTFDTNYYSILNQNKGLFQSDAALLNNSTSRDYVNQQLNKKEFFKNFEKSMRKLSEIQVKTGNAGQIRRQCAFVNS